MNFFEFHIGDYTEATCHLTFVEDAALGRLIRKIYATEKPLPSDYKAVQRLIGARSKDERQAVQTMLNEFFTLQGDGWHNPRCDDELARYQVKRDKARASAEARWSAPQPDAPKDTNAMRTHAETGANAMPTQGEGDAEAMLSTPIFPLPTSLLIKDQNLDTDAAHPVKDDQFELLKAIYPKRAGGQPWVNAKKACSARIREGHTWQQLLDGCQRYADHCRDTGKERTQFVQQAATFFGPNKGFEDPWEIPATKADNQRDANVEASKAWLNGTH